MSFEPLKRPDQQLAHAWMTSTEKERRKVLILRRSCQSRLRDLNPGPQLYESCSLPLS